MTTASEEAALIWSATKAAAERFHPTATTRRSVKITQHVEPDVLRAIAKEAGAAVDDDYEPSKSHDGSWRRVLSVNAEHVGIAFLFVSSEPVTVTVAAAGSAA